MAAESRQAEITAGWARNTAPSWLEFYESRDAAVHSMQRIRDETADWCDEVSYNAISCSFASG